MTAKVFLTKPLFHHLATTLGISLISFLPGSTRANTIEFVTPQLITADFTVSVQGFYDSSAHTLDWVARATTPGGGPILSLFAPTGSPLTGVAPLALTDPVVDLHRAHSVTEFVSFFPQIDLTDPLTYDPAFLTANGGTASGAEAGLIQALFSQEAYLNGFFNERMFLSAVPDAGNSGAFLALALIGVIGATALDKRSRGQT